MTDRYAALRAAASEPGLPPYPQPPYRLVGPSQQGGFASIEGTGWAIPIMALGLEGPLARILDVLNRYDALLAERDRLREALRDFHRQIVSRHPGYAGDHYVWTVQFNQASIDRIDAALAESDR